MHLLLIHTGFEVSNTRLSVFYQKIRTFLLFQSAAASYTINCAIASNKLRTTLTNVIRYVFTWIHRQIHTNTLALSYVRVCQFAYKGNAFLSSGTSVQNMSHHCIDREWRCYRCMRISNGFVLFCSDMIFMVERIFFSDNRNMFVI